MPSFSLCVYCGSRDGKHPAYVRAADAVGRCLARQGGRLVYGGGRVGLMGVVADAVLAEGGEVVGVIPQTLMDREVGHPGLTELHVVQTMHERKRLMAERADAFLALPGGIGTFEELFEVWTWRQLGYHDKPVGLLNVQGYYDGLLGFLGHTVAQGFLSPAQHGVLQVSTDPAALLEALRTQAQQATAPDDYRKI
ncbi:TIGR00730 family Rossman fold protein [Caldimonas caldifontis]|uniref:Cytokinin riboside 5'-monophosphate phosphoribohydrolase n=1 Tax=Caldimonas caldifontis TaxID=1452508 RepID=A0A2S5ST01_9BURK|nr:TIGR00730 family Rossman fold protein [Caldimonas caldifontis]PPE65865.1 TIGR00730 family Rossman fold protein [Caldimonas caldifontis]